MPVVVLAAWTLWAFLSAGMLGSYAGRHGWPIWLFTAVLVPLCAINAAVAGVAFAALGVR